MAHTCSSDGRLGDLVEQGQPPIGLLDRVGQNFIGRLAGGQGVHNLSLSSRSASWIPKSVAASPMFLCAPPLQSACARMCRSPRSTGYSKYRQQIVNQGRLRLTVAIDAAIALLQGNRRPGNVKMDHKMAEVVQVHPSEDHIGGQQMRMGLWALPKSPGQSPVARHRAGQHERGQ